MADWDRDEKAREALSDFDQMLRRDLRGALVHEGRKLAVTERLAEMGFHVPDDEKLDRLLDAIRGDSEAGHRSRDAEVRELVEGLRSLELAARHEEVEELFMLNQVPKLYAAICEARALLARYEEGSEDG